MYGFKAINAYNGWVMALTGALIVFGGLVILALAISQIHTLLTLWENRKGFFKRRIKPDHDKMGAAQRFLISERFPLDIKEVAALYQPLVEKLGPSFQLVELYEMARKEDFPHPHLTISFLRRSKILLPQGEGVFIWNDPKAPQKIKG